MSYVVNRNINYTNICTYHCGFCAFSKGRSARSLRGPATCSSLDEIGDRTREAWDRGATEVCLQGGIHPSFTGDTYLDIVAAVKQAAPRIHVHAFSPLEVSHGARTLGLSLESFLQRLEAQGLSTLPGTAAEILDDEVRDVLCPDKLRTAEWLEVMETAHRVGLRTTATIMFGHVDGFEHWARHLIRIRELQRRTGGFTEFVPLPFVHMEAPLWRTGRARSGPSFREALLMHAVARLVLHPSITHIQTSWVKMGAAGAGLALRAGADDLGGTLMNESITRAAGGAHGQEMTVDRLHELAAGAGRRLWQRTTLYHPCQPGRGSRRNDRRRRGSPRPAALRSQATSGERRKRSAGACSDRRHRGPGRRARATLGTVRLSRDPRIARCQAAPPMPLRASRPSALRPCAGSAIARRQRRPTLSS